MKDKIHLEKEPDSSWPHERCCFCYSPTIYWIKINGKVTGESVACCKKCANEHDMKEVPSKKEWCEDIRQRIN